MLHEYDSCCYQSTTLYSKINAYDKFLQSQLVDGKSWFQTSAKLSDFDETDYRDKATINMTIERLRRKKDLPYNIIEHECGTMAV
jgi:hypothetical protein